VIEFENIVPLIVAFQDRYEPVATTSTVPWYVIAVIHNMECGLDFAEHLHNGDPLARRTINDPPKRFGAIASRLHPNYRAQS
jgi:lysozyme family protein